MAKNILWIPGPTEVRPEILAECARPMIGHRSKAMTALTERLDPHLKLAFGLAQGSTAHVAVHTCAATGMMESSLRGVGPKVLCLVNGSFSKRFAEIAEQVGKTVVKLSVPMGQSVSMNDLETALREKGPFDAVTLVSNETSAGVRTPLAEVAAVMKKFPDVMLLVDLVSYIAGAPVDFDANRMDFAFAGIQKALALPPGLTVACASQRYLENAKNQKLRGFYLDPINIIEGHEQRATPATPAISLYYALAKQLEDISAGVMLYDANKGKTGAAAWRARFDEHLTMVKTCEAWAERQGLKYLAVPALRSPTVSCIEKGDLDVAALIAGLKEKGHEIGNGYGDLKDKSFRIGHMGDHTNTRLKEMLAQLDVVVDQLRRAAPQAR
ncbi:MAG: alanine--glyoxylate aminotransferase family protein [Planctomycetes bacterium]|nr:alanine--glyoxylate aminotransferase family protein [Planctomycetota bacterium]